MRGSSYALPTKNSPRLINDSDEVTPSALGWTNLFIPGGAALLRGQTGRGLLEGIAEIGLFYGGTFGVREGAFTIDSTIVVPLRGNLQRPLIGQILQQFGLKLHMYNTFYHYQQRSLELADTEKEKSNGQPLYKGGWDDTLLAPFKPSKLFDPFVIGLIAATAVYSFIEYRTDPVVASSYHSTGTEDVLYGMNSALIQPLGSSFGEEALFRGFLMREARGWTGSFVLSTLLQSGIFTLLHPAEAKLPAFLGGVYLGYLVERNHGDLEPSIAAHFWINVVRGAFQYLAFQRAQGKSTPFSAPPVSLLLWIPFTL